MVWAKRQESDLRFQSRIGLVLKLDESELLANLELYWSGLQRIRRQRSCGLSIDEAVTCMRLA